MGIFTVPTENGKKVLAMAEYIEREAILKEAESRIMWGASAAAVYELIRDAPAADVVQVVRCQDCEYFRLNDENVPYCLNPFGLDDPEPNGFCNYGIGKN